MTAYTPWAGLIAMLGLSLSAQELPVRGEFRTDLSKSSIELSELRGGGPPKDGIPALLRPKFDSVQRATTWLDDREPVLVVESEGQVRAYPFQILMFHELANDMIGDLPVLASYCPLCNSAIAFDRRLDGKTHTFGVSGMLRHSDMVMYDHQTETLWQQLTGEGIVGELTGRTLRVVSSQVAHFGAVRERFPDAQVLNRDTGTVVPYGQTPYVGYEGRGGMMFPAAYPHADRIRALDRLVAIYSEIQPEAHTLASVARGGVRTGKIDDEPYVIFYDPEAVGAMDAKRISDSKQVGSVGVFSPIVDGQELKFRSKKNRITDTKTGSEWNLFGEAISGPHQGTRLRALDHGVFYAFAWLAFRPDTTLRGLSPTLPDEPAPQPFAPPR
jgi:hypothetical protein